MWDIIFMALRLRAATRDDAADIATLVNIAAEGLPMAFWSDQGVLGQDPLETGSLRCAETDTVFSWRRATIAEVDGLVAGMIIAHATSEVPAEIDESVHPMFRPMVRLSRAALDTQFLNTLAVYPKYRRQGIASRLLNDVELRSNQSDVALITSNINDAGQAFCKRLSYKFVERAPVIKGNWVTDASSWHLLRKMH